MCICKNIHSGHKIIDINDEESLKKENISIEDSSRDLNENKNKLEELKNKIENEMIKIDDSYDKIDKEVTKSYKLKHEKLLNEEELLKDKLKNEVTKIKENLELNISKISELIRNCERIIKGIKAFKEEENNMIKKLNYVSNINNNQKEMNLMLKHLMKNLNILFDDNNIIYEEYYFNGLPIPKDIEFSDKNINSFKVSWKIDDVNLINIDKKQFKYIVEVKKENDKFITLYEGNENNCIIKNLNYETNYQLRICSSYKNIKSNYSNIYNIKTDFLDSIILDKNEKRKEYINKIIEWCGGCKSMKLLYRGTRDGMTSKIFHEKCDNKGKTICLFLNGKGNIFGGYSSIPWTNNGGDKIANDCFLFTLTNIYNIEPTKFPYEKGRSVYHYSSNGPNFGGGTDLGFKSDFSTGNNSCWCKFPDSYKDILGKGRSIFTSDNNNNNQYFSLKDIEVFEILS